MQFFCIIMLKPKRWFTNQWIWKELCVTKCIVWTGFKFSRFENYQKNGGRNCVVLGDVHTVPDSEMKLSRKCTKIASVHTGNALERLLHNKTLIVLQTGQEQLLKQSKNLSSTVWTSEREQKPIRYRVNLCSHCTG